jgi:Domain of unknown function (DUF2760)
MKLGKRVSYAWRCFFAILFGRRISPDIALELGMSSQVIAPRAGATQPKTEEFGQKPSESFDRAVQILALLQREGRILDFLAEDVAPYPDAQLGAAVRSVHEGCRKALERYVKLEPIIASDEDHPVIVQAGFDPASVRVIGKVAGKPPLRGLLRHRGWRAVEMNLPPLPEGLGRSVVAQAEVEVE